MLQYTMRSIAMDGKQLLAKFVSLPRTFETFLQPWAWPFFTPPPRLTSVFNMGSLGTGKSIYRKVIHVHAHTVESTKKPFNVQSCILCVNTAQIASGQLQSLTSPHMHSSGSVNIGTVQYYSFCST